MGSKPYNRNTDRLSRRAGKSVAKRKVLGVCGIIIKLDDPPYSVPPYQELTPVLRYIR